VMANHSAQNVADAVARLKQAVAEAAAELNGAQEPEKLRATA